MSRRRRNGIAVVAVVAFVGVVAGLGLVGTTANRIKTVPPTTIIPTTTTNPYAAVEASDVAAAERAVNVTLPARDDLGAPSLPAHAYTTTLGAHQVVGFVPYYELGSISGEDLNRFTDLVYYDLDVRADGTLDEVDSSLGWASLENGGAGDLVSAGHAAGDRVLLSLFSESQSVLGPLSAHGVTDGTRLADVVAPLLSRYDFDGVDLDLEGQDASDQVGFVAFVAAFSKRLRALGASWTIMLNTYPQSAEPPEGFFDVEALAPYVDEFFVMAYDMDSTEIPSANAPLDGADLSDAAALATYVGAGLGSKVILGIPFYGYDFPSAGPGRETAVVSPPYAVTYDNILTSITVDHHKPLWDPVTETPYTVFRYKKAWHQTWFDDPVSVALKTALADRFGVAGVGAWEIGMVANAQQMISALDGGSPPVKLLLPTRP